jgi:hypothetical protein
VLLLETYHSNNPDVTGYATSPHAFGVDDAAQLFELPVQDPSILTGSIKL